jgi:signal peptidase I
MQKIEIVSKKKSKTREYVESILTALLVAFLIRSFIVEAFKIPSGSMIPTLMIGDHIFVNKFAYGLRIPFTKKKIVTFGEPQRGEPIVFMYPLDESKDFIKRVIGLPGDHISLVGDDVFIENKPLDRSPITVTHPKDATLLDVDQTEESVATGIKTIPVFPGWENYHYFIETLPNNRAHLTQFDEDPPRYRKELVVPQGHLFVMGDNRDNSSDSREWGFVPIENVKGRAMFVWLSLDYDRKTIRWNRFGKWIQ